MLNGERSDDLRVRSRIVLLGGSRDGDNSNISRTSRAAIEPNRTRPKRKNGSCKASSQPEASQNDDGKEKPFLVCR